MTLARGDRLTLLGSFISQEHNITLAMLVGFSVSNPAAQPEFQVALTYYGEQAPPNPPEESFFQAVGQKCLLMSSQICHILILKNLFRIADTALAGFILAGLQQQAAGTGSDVPLHLTSFMDKDPDQINTSILDAVSVSRDRVNLDRLPQPYTDACDRV